MEPVGLTLGILPIIASATKQYVTLYKICKRYRRYQEGLDDLLDDLKIQQVIFTNEVKLLLVTVVSRDECDTMLANTNHPLWQNPDLESRLNAVLNDSAFELIKAARRVHISLTILSDEINKCTSDIRPPNPTDQDTASIVIWKKRLRAKFSYATSKTKLNGMKAGVRDATTDFRILRAQVQDLASKKPTPRATDQTPGDAGLRRMMITQAAAKHVYTMLGRACRLHDSHHARFGLSPVYSHSPATSGTQIQFQVAFYDQSGRPTNQQTRDGFWFLVKSTIPRTVPVVISTEAQAQSSSSSRATTLAALQDNATPKGKQRQTLSIRSRMSPSTGTPPTPSQASSPATAASITLDLGTDADICTQLQSHCQSGHQNDQCIGVIKVADDWRHEVYPGSGPVLSQSGLVTTESSRSLDYLLAPPGPNTPASHQLTVLQRLRLAKDLSMAVLSLHSTPWIESTLTSQDILFYNSPSPRSDASSSTRPGLFVDAIVQNSRNSLALQQHPSQISLLVQNLPLFRLGVLLLELAFEKPLRLMQGTPVVTSAETSGILEFQTALRKSKEVSTCLGLRYSEIVRQCLYCDFGKGSDLDSPALQEAVHHSVVFELESLELGFQQLGVT